METESLIISVQNQNNRTNLVKSKIDSSQENSINRFCKKSDVL